MWQLGWAWLHILGDINQVRNHMKSSFFYSGFRVDGTNPYICLLDGDPYKPPFGDFAIYSQSTISDADI